MANENTTLEVVSLTEENPPKDIINPLHPDTPVLDEKSSTENSEHQPPRAPLQKAMDATSAEPPKQKTGPAQGVIDLLNKTDEEASQSNQKVLNESKLGKLANAKVDSMVATATEAKDTIKRSGVAVAHMAEDTGAAIMTHAADTMSMGASAVAQKATKVFKNATEQLKSKKENTENIELESSNNSINSNP